MHLKLFGNVTGNLLKNSIARCRSPTEKKKKAEISALRRVRNDVGQFETNLGFMSRYQRAESPTENPFLVSLEQKGPQSFRTCQVIKISAKPHLLGKAYRSQVWGNSTSWEGTPCVLILYFTRTCSLGL
jgi:hypothetical protein